MAGVSERRLQALISKRKARGGKAPPDLDASLKAVQEAIVRPPTQQAFRINESAPRQSCTQNQLPLVLAIPPLLFLHLVLQVKCSWVLQGLPAAARAHGPAGTCGAPAKADWDEKPEDGDLTCPSQISQSPVTSQLPAVSVVS